MKKLIVFTSLLAIIVLTGMTCAPIDPGAEVFVVRTEQAQSTANATFDFILHFDHANRGFWRTNAPAFHSFCEWLRTPMDYGSNRVSRAVAMQLNVSDLKVAYKSARTPGNSNALWSALSVLNTAVLQATSWSNIVVTPTHP